MTIAVTGAAGQVGSRVAHELAGCGLDVVAIVRRTGAAPVGPRLRERLASYDDPDALTVAMEGVDTLVFIGSDGPADEMLMHHDHVLGAAATSGVERIVLLSSQDADTGSPFCYARVCAWTESWTKATSAQPVIVRAGLYSEFLGNWVRNAGHQGVLRLPMPQAVVAPIARHDVARALIACVTKRNTRGTYTVTGPQRLDLAALANAGAAWAGTPVLAESCSAAWFAAELARVEMDPWWRYAYSTMFTAIEQGRFGTVTGDLRALTGTCGTSFAQAMIDLPRTGGGAVEHKPSTK